MSSGRFNLGRTSSSGASVGCTINLILRDLMTLIRFSSVIGHSPAMVLLCGLELTFRRLRISLNRKRMACLPNAIEIHGRDELIERFIPNDDWLTHCGAYLFR